MNRLKKGLLCSEFLCSWALSIVQYSKKLENTTFWKHDPDKVQEPGNSECHTPSSEPFRIEDYCRWKDNSTS
jgi:hypothetical protein